MIRIAIIEDDAQCAAKLSGYLSRFRQESGQPLSVSAYPHGRAFLEDFRSQFDLILLDIEMPHLDGMETARRIRRTD